MSKKLIYLVSFVLLLGSTVHAALYLWNGSAGDGNWDTHGNWTVTDSLWTWPNEENAADPNMAKYINSDTIGINILNGGVVSRGSELAIQGAPDGSTTGVLTLNNGSSLTVTGRLATATYLTGRGQIDILGGSTVNVIGEGNDLTVADDANSWGTLNIFDSIVNISDDLRIDEGEGYVNIGGISTINADDIIAGDSATGVGYIDINGPVTINVDELKTDEGKGHIKISGNPIINLDDLMIDQPTGVGTVDIGGSATITIVDDVLIDEAIGTINIGGTATISNGDDFTVGDDGPSVGTVNIGGDATINVKDILYVAHNEGSEGHLTIGDNATVNILNDLIIANAAGLTATLHISGNPTINIASEFYMNDDSSEPMVPSTSEVIMDGGTVNVVSNSNLNDDNNGTATFTMNGGRWNSGGYLNLSDNLDGTAHLTMNGGEMITGGQLRLGKDGGTDIGQVRIFMNGGLLQAEGLDIKITDTKIIYTGGVFRIGSASLSEDGMRQLITNGTIVAEGAYSIVTDGAYTALITKAATGPNPADGAVNVPLDAIVSWWPGFGAVSHDVYFGTSSPPALVGNQATASYNPGPLQGSTTYYWQINAVEADGVTVHAGPVWSFTTVIVVSKWTYTYAGDAAISGPANSFDSLDGTWDNNNGSDSWDGSVIGAGMPGGVSALDGFLRLQDPGDPRDYAMPDPSNRKLYFGHSITNEIGAEGDAILDTGVTISFRARVATGPPLDDLHPDGGAGIAAWPAGGDGYVGHNDGKGNFGIRQLTDDKIISFSLALASDSAFLGGKSGLVMNSLNGTSPSGSVDAVQSEGTLNILELDPTQWHEFWITIEPDASATGTHLVKVYLDGSLVSNDFIVTAGNGNDYNDSYIAMGLGATDQSGAIDVDYFSYKQGILAPSP